MTTTKRVSSKASSSSKASAPSGASAAKRGVKRAAKTTSRSAAARTSDKPRPPSASKSAAAANVALLISATREMDELEASFQKMKPAMMKLTEPELLTVSLESTGAVTTVLGLQTRLNTLRDDANHVSPCDPTCFDRLGDCTRALAYAQMNALNPTPRTRADITTLGATGLTMREKLFRDVSYLKHYGLIDPTRLEPIKNLIGYKNVGFDLLMLAKLVRESWTQIEGKTLITLDEVAQAHTLGLQLLEAAGEREQSAPNNEAAEMRQRAFTLFVNTYDEVRRIVTFLRWNEGDADDFCPSLYAGRYNKSASKKAPTDTPAPGPDTAHDTTPGTHGAASPASHPESPVAGGLKVPGGNPFIS